MSISPDTPEMLENMIRRSTSLVHRTSINLRSYSPKSDSFDLDFNDDLGDDSDVDSEVNPLMAVTRKNHITPYFVIPTNKVQKKSFHVRVKPWAKDLWNSFF